MVPDDFAGLSFERGPLNAGNAGVDGYLFRPDNDSLVTCSATWGCAACGSAADRWTSTAAGTGPDGYTGMTTCSLRAAAQAQVIYSLRLLSPSGKPVAGLKSADAEAAGYIWGRYREHLASFAIGNEPDWHASAVTRATARPAIYEEIGGSRAAPTRRTWPPGRTSPGRCGRRRPARRWPGRTPGPTRR